LSIPNIISMARLLAVPVVVYLILKSSYDWAFWLFVIAGFSDALDGFIAKNMDQATVLGSYLDPLADKALLVGVYVTLGHQALIDDLIVVMVVFRDVMIIGGAFLLVVFRQQNGIRPALVSKLNTAAQILLVTLVLAEAGLDFTGGWVSLYVSYFVIATTIASGGWYMIAWGRQMASVEDTK
jgi:cardiolipin synthase (CMP-forming)